MDFQARRCINCRAYDTKTNECALHPVREPLTDAKVHWCMEGKWSRYDDKNNRWQLVTMLDEALDMEKTIDEPPIGRAIDTSMMTVDATKEITVDGQVIEKIAVVEGPVRG